MNTTPKMKTENNTVSNVSVDSSIFAQWTYDVYGRVKLDGETVEFHAEVIVTWGHDVLLGKLECDHPRVGEVKEAVLRAARERMYYCGKYFIEPPDLFPDVEITSGMT